MADNVVDPLARTIDLRRNAKAFMWQSLDLIVIVSESRKPALPAEPLVWLLARRLTRFWPGFWPGFWHYPMHIPVQAMGPVPGFDQSSSKDGRGTRAYPPPRIR